MFIKDLADTTYAFYLHEGIKVKSVGWLGDFVPQSGTVPGKFMELLSHLYEFHNIADEELDYHKCEICKDYISHGEMWLNLGKTRYVMPLMIIHYIQAHGYSPPKDFIHEAIKFWDSTEAVQCKLGSCDILPKGSFKGFYGKESELANEI